MKILHFSSAKSWRGGEQQLAYLAEELRQRNIEQILYCAVGSRMAQWAREQGFSVSTYRKGFSLNPGPAIKLKRICRREGISLVHTHDNHAHTFAWLAALLGNKTPLVVSRRVDFSIAKSRFSLAKYRHPAVRRILCVSEAIRQIVLRDLPDPERVKTVYSGIDLSRFDVQPDGRLRDELGIPAEVPLIGKVAALAPHKDYPTFVRTAVRLAAALPNARFVIIGGDGGEEARIRQLVAEAGLADRIHFTGFRKDIPYILPELDVFLFTSKTEGLGTSLLDAFAAGVPVVATEGGGIPEIVQHGKTGLTAPVGDDARLAERVQNLLGDETLQQQLIAGARARVQQFSRAATAEATLQQYLSV